jgi:hypothetical protein
VCLCVCLCVWLCVCVCVWLCVCVCACVCVCLSLSLSLSVCVRVCVRCMYVYFFFTVETRELSWLTVGFVMRSRSTAMLFRSLVGWLVGGFKRAVRDKGC